MEEDDDLTYIEYFIDNHQLLENLLTQTRVKNKLQFHCLRILDRISSYSDEAMILLISKDFLDLARDILRSPDVELRIKKNVYCTLQYFSMGSEEVAGYIAESKIIHQMFEDFTKFTLS